jgi:hypothetical protein
MSVNTRQLLVEDGPHEWHGGIHPLRTAPRFDYFSREPARTPVSAPVTAPCRDPYQYPRGQVTHHHSGTGSLLGYR